MSLNKNLQITTSQTTTTKNINNQIAIKIFKIIH
jgi:hypothetical protein